MRGVVSAPLPFLIVSLYSCARHTRSCGARRSRPLISEPFLKNIQTPPNYFPPGVGEPICRVGRFNKSLNAGSDFEQVRLYCFKERTDQVVV